MSDSLLNPSTSNTTSLSSWIERWQENRIGFHRTFVSDLFKKYLLSKLISSKEQQCIVFPLCGKTLDMKAILDLGHRVIGMEVSQMAIEAFFHENKISYEIEENQCKVYSGINHPITIYCVDFFTFNKSLPHVDYIWDRGGLVAINPSNQEQYRDCLLRMMTPVHTQLFLVAINYIDPIFSGPPFIISDDSIHRLFGSECSLQLIETHDETEEFNLRDSSRRIDFIEERLHLIVRKKV